MFLENCPGDMNVRPEVGIARPVYNVGAIKTANRLKMALNKIRANTVVEQEVKN